MDLVNTYTNVGQTDIDNLELTTDYQRRGYHQLTLTEMDTTTIPQVAAGSMVEVGGALYEADTAESISGSATTGTNYIYLVPGSSIVTPTWTTTAPTWSDAKQGWYGTGGSASYRYMQYQIDFDGATAYENKTYMFEKNKQLSQILVRRSAFYNLTSGNPILFDAIDYDSKGEYSAVTGRVTFTNSGLYRISYSLRFDALGATVQNWDGNVYKNGAVLTDNNSYTSVSGSMGGSFTDFFDATEYIYCSSTGSPQVAGGSYLRSYLNVIQIG